MSVDQSIVSFDQVSMCYEAGPAIFEDVSFHLQPGSFHFLTGASGSGKSTLIKLLFLGEGNFKGDIRVLGRNVKGLDADEQAHLRRQIGVVFQDFYLLDHLTALENVALALQVRGVSKRESRSRAEEMLGWVGLSRVFHSTIDVLSGGEKQRVAFARAIVTRPKLLLADEPTGSVDDAMAVKLLCLFEELNQRGTTVVLATHNRDLVSEFTHPELHLSDRTLWYHGHDQEDEKVQPEIEMRRCA
ncbi:MAG: ATP-binding cassette domain-containing protein [Pseudomonadota bacterium]